MKTLIALILAFAAFLAAPAFAQNAPLKAGDPVLIELKNPPEDKEAVTGAYTISTHGTIKVPYLSQEISARGLSTTELSRRIEQAYRAAEIYTAPTIVINTPNPQGHAPHIVTVGGEVKSGGREVPLRDGMRLYQAIMSAGGFTEFADVRKVKIIRGTRAFVYDMRRIDEGGSNNPILLDGDTIHVPAD